MYRRKSTNLGRVLILFFTVNSFCLLLYFVRYHPNPAAKNLPATTSETGHNSPIIRLQTLKPWPDLPSFLPWVPNPNPPPRSCEAYFGNGFSRRIDLLGSSSDPTTGGWLRCFHSETLASSICEGGRLRMDSTRIRMSDGGEMLESVIGRQEEDELPKFELGAFEIEASSGEVPADRKIVSEELLDRFLPQGDIQMHTMRDLVDSIRIVGPGELECSQWIDEPTLLVTRFEYANVFHTVTDWYSAYASSRVTNLPSRPHVIFVDGHCKTQLEETWEALFSSVRYAKNFTGPVCFRRAILSPLGYETAMFKGLSESFSCHGASARDLRANPHDRKTARLSEFGEMLRLAFFLPLLEQSVSKPAVSVHNVLFVRREDYLAHPRHDGRVQSRLSNEQDVVDHVEKWAAADHKKCEVNFVNGLFAHMPMKEQLQAIQEASVVIGAHGAGLTHLVSASPNAIVLEIISSMYRRPHFALISRWKGLRYHAINLAGSHVEPSVVVEKLDDIMRSLGC